MTISRYRVYPPRRVMDDREGVVTSARRHDMNAELWFELLIVLAKILAAGLDT